ncbi:MAG: hypothetical protein GX189_02390 [Clostridiales bacterium]|nr:hypothetical protein [Clostridiales bacterium]
MFNISWDEFWWTNITGPNVVVTTVAMHLLECANVVLSVPSDLPWRHSMRSSIHSEFKYRSMFQDIIIEPIDVADENPDHLEPGRFILQRFGDDAAQRGFRDKSKMTIQDYISQKEILKNRIVWVKGLSGQTAPQWINLCRGFTPKNYNEGLFVLEVPGDVRFRESSRMRLVSYNKCVTSYDVRLLNSFILDSIDKRSNVWKNYIATVAAVLCDTDAEVSECLLQNVSFAEESPVEGLRRIAEQPEFARRGQESHSGHILQLYRKGNLPEIERRIWSAQVQTLFPIIEMERIEIIKRNFAAIKKALEQEVIVQYNEEITNPYDVELGTLCHLMSKRGSDGHYLLYIPDEALRDRIRFLHECRNLLAHAECCSPYQVAELLKNY